MTVKDPPALLREKKYKMNKKNPQTNLACYLPSLAIQPAIIYTSVEQEAGMWPAKEFVVLLSEMSNNSYQRDGSTERLVLSMQKGARIYRCLVT